MQRQRDCYFDNAKFILIVLVVLGHGLELIRGVYVSALYELLYLFHMPAFALITGYFAKGRFPPKIGGLLGQYMVFQTLYLLFDRFVLEGETKFSYMTPYWLLWFLVSVITWKLLAPLVARYPFPLVMGIAVLVAVLAGYDTSVTRFLSISRTIVFFPFFLAGVYARREHFDHLKRLPAFAPVLTFVLSFAALYVFKPFERYFLYGTGSYEGLRMEGLQAGLTRLGSIVWGFLLVCSFLALVPRGHIAISKLGQRTGPVYLLHGFVIRYLGHALPLPVLLDSALEKLLFFAALLGLVLLLMAKPLAKALAPLLDPVRFFSGRRGSAHT